MQAFRLSAVLTADGSAARKEIAATGKGVRGLEQELDRMTRGGREAARALDGIESEARQTAAALNTVDDAARNAAQGARGVQEAHVMAAGSVGNLTAQFNDIGVMMAAGQNPLQLAVQQGTQITQVFGNQGAAAALRSTSAALMSMVSPLNLITIGGIAAGAMAFQWLTDAGEEAEKYEDRLERVSDALDRYRELSEAATGPTDDLVERWGRGAEALRGYYAALAESERNRLLGPGVNDLMSGAFLSNGQSYDRPAIRDRFGLRDGPRDRQMVAGFQGLENDLANAQGIDAQIEAMNRLIQGATELAALRGGINTSEQEYIDLLNKAASEMVKIRGATDQQAAAKEAETQRQAEIYGLYQSTRAESDASLSAAQQMQAELGREVEIRQAIVLHGAESAEVAALRADAERDVYAASVEALDVSEALKQEMLESYDAAAALAATDMASGIAAAGSEAMALADYLNISLATAAKLAAMGGQGVPQTDPNTGMRYSGRGGDPREQGGDSLDWQTREATEWLANWEPPKPPKPRSARRGGGGGGGRSSIDAAARELDRQREAVERLIQREQDELALLRETDPIQKEMLRNREALAAATDAERLQVEDLIRTRLEEEAAVAQATERYEAFRDISFDAISGLSKGGDEAAAAIDRITASIENAAMQALLLGEGPLAGLFGTGASGGFLGMIGGALFPNAGAAAAVPSNADGGMFYAPGDSRADAGLSWLSSGEFIVNASATARHRALLEAINSGSDLPRYANGGAVGGGRGDSFGSPVFQIVNPPGMPLSAEVEEDRTPTGQRRFRFILADQVSESLTLQGGSARRTMRDGFGMSPRRVKR